MQSWRESGLHAPIIEVIFQVEAIFLLALAGKRLASKVIPVLCKVNLPATVNQVEPKETHQTPAYGSNN